MSEVGIPVMAGSTPMEMTNTINKRRLIRAAKNPLDKCTLVSIYPKDIEEYKPTIEPGRFCISAGTYDNPSTLIVGSSSWWKDTDADQPMLEMQRSSIEIVNSIITDYSNSMLGFSGDSMPGLFFILGEHDVKDIKTNYKKKLDETKAKQDNWFRILVKLADSLWSRTNQNPLAIWEDMRLAARSLNLNDKAWLKDYQIAELVRCMACGGLKDPKYPVCPSCKNVDMSHPSAKDLKFSV